MEFQSNWAAHGPRGNPRNEIQDMIVFQKMPKDWINPATGKIGTEKEFYETYRDASLSQVQEKIDMTMWEINYHEEQLKNFLGGGIYIMDPNGSRRILDASNMSKAEFETQLINLDQQVLKNLNYELGIHTQNYEILQNQNLDIKNYFLKMMLCIIEFLEKVFYGQHKMEQLHIDFQLFKQQQLFKVIVRPEELV